MLRNLGTTLIFLKALKNITPTLMRPKAIFFVLERSTHSENTLENGDFNYYNRNLLPVEIQINWKTF